MARIVRCTRGNLIETCRLDDGSVLFFSLTDGTCIGGIGNVRQYIGKTKEEIEK